MIITRSRALRGVITAGLLLASAASAQAQQASVTGRVTEQGTGAPIAEAQVSIVGTNLGGMTTAEGRYVIRNVPAGRLARSEESAKLCVFLACDESDFFCGQVIPFAGGWI